MADRTVLVANRGEIAVRIIRSVTALGWTSVAAHPADDAGGRHLQLADRVVTLPGIGPIGDGPDVVALGDRDCSVQRRRQKLVEIAPDPTQRQGLADAAVAMAAEVGFAGLGTFEFLVDVEGGTWVFVEANPRLQVEHTVTEEVFGVDLVAAGLRIATGATIVELDLGAPRGMAVDARVNAEVGGTLTRFEAPTGPGVRTDTAAGSGDRVDPRFDPLVAKVVGHSPTAELAPAATRTAAALTEMEVAGVAVNIGLPLVSHVVNSLYKCVMMDYGKDRSTESAT